MVGDGVIPGYLAGSCVERHDVRLGGVQVDLVPVQGYRTAAPARPADSVGIRDTRRGRRVLPEKVAGRRVECLHAVARVRDVHHPGADQRRRLAEAGGQRPGPGKLQEVGVVTVDLLERAVAPAVESTPPAQPVGGVRILEHRVGDRCDVRNLGAERHGCQEHEHGGRETASTAVPGHGVSFPVERVRKRPARLLPPSYLSPAIAGSEDESPGWLNGTELSVVQTQGNAATRTFGFENTLHRNWSGHFREPTTRVRQPASGRSGRRCEGAGFFRALLELVVRSSGDVAYLLLHGAWNPQPRVGAEPFEQRRALRPALELEGLLGPLGDAVRRASPEVPRVDVGALGHEVLDHFVQAAVRRAVQRREVGLVGGIDVGPGLQQKPGPPPPRSRSGRRAARAACRWRGRGPPPP